MKFNGNKAIIRNNQVSRTVTTPTPGVGRKASIDPVNYNGYVNGRYITTASVDSIDVTYKTPRSHH